ncbi:hypothetical protein EVAR_37398_1 [Eumeta japonica]|uniref:Uncharacterized protein n=1 Tax=Eumeta variegata TaxID=151549 RepID=A0A4C1WDZ9_EUMVA|nr:hypothetical protein EVAR_37398_1 [Eumeta japonica]
MSSQHPQPLGGEGWPLVRLASLRAARQFLELFRIGIKRDSTRMSHDVEWRRKEFAIYFWYGQSFVNCAREPLRVVNSCLE